MAALRGHSLATGAIATFTGLVSREGESAGVDALELEHYPGMAERALATIADEAQRRWSLHALLVCHRVGHLVVGEPIVFVGVASRHRDAAFEACRFVMDCLKTDAPFWKKEHRGTESRWVEARERDTQARTHWEKD